MRNEQRIDWDEKTTASMVRAAKRTGYMTEIMEDAKDLVSSGGFVWVVALKMSLSYWSR